MSVSIVVQRFRKCKLLLNEVQWVTVGDDGENSSSCGLLAYISFGASTTQPQVETAAQTLLNLPVLTTGLWGDSSSTQSILGLATASISSCSLVIVPQANLISKVKGKSSIQYHGQIDKERGEQLYDYFCSYIQGLLLEGQCKARSEDLPEWYTKWKTFLEQQQQNKKSYSPSTPPDEMFRDASKYSEWDERGIPTKDSEGNALTKSGIKKLTKFYEAHRKKHIKWKEEQQKSGDDCASEQTLPSSVAAEAPPVEQWEGCLDGSFCHFVKGSFGKRQGLEFTSDMGPFVHSFQV